MGAGGARQCGDCPGPCPSARQPQASLPARTRHGSA
jgi:hypothetical protein